MKRFAITLTFLLIASHTTASSEPVNIEQSGRVRICISKDYFHPEKSQSIEIPAGGKFTIRGSKDGVDAPISIQQTNFPSGMIGNTNSVVIPNGYSVSFYNKDGNFVANIDVTGKGCIYLSASGPLVDDRGQVLSGISLVPDWDVPLKSTDSIKYFTPVDPTYYVASDIGRNLQYVVHEMTTGSNINHDFVNNVETKNELIKSFMTDDISSALAKLNQLDVNALDYEKLDANLYANDLNDEAKRDAFVARFRRTVNPPPHSRLILALPLREPVKVLFDNYTMYGSKVEGLGFYVDYRIGTSTLQSGDGVGALDVFLNCQFIVMDLDSAKVLAIRNYVGGRVFSAAHASNGSVFDTLNESEMFSMLDDVVYGGVTKVFSDIFDVK